MIRRGEGGRAARGKKDTGYLYKAFMAARGWGAAICSMLNLTPKASLATRLRL